jgi:hypothetical protein
MGQNVRRVLQMEKPGETRTAGCVGRIVRVEADGDVIVDFPGNRLGPIRARVATSEELATSTSEPLLLNFEEANPALPIVVGVVKEGTRRATPKRVLTLDATGEITITCGKSSIMLRSDGRIVIKGTELLSRASRTNKIRGAAVKIN